MGAGHDHDTAGSNRVRLAIAFGITATVLAAEAVGAWITGSLALLVDAGHMLTDAGGLLMALLAATAMTKPPTARRTWGWARIEILAAGAQAAILLGVGIYAFVEGLQRLLAPPEIAAGGLLLLGILGLIANIASVLVLSGGRGHNLNMRAAFLEVVNDALGSIAVIASALAIHYTGWTQADALAGMLISVLIVPRALTILRQAGSVLLETVPKGLNLDDVRTHLLELPHVTDVHDLHASLIGTGLPVLTAHVVVEDQCFHDGHTDELLDQLQACVRQHFPVSVEHSTFQLEPASHTSHENDTHA
ncbi:cobalt-zinc-cadmium efflux system protein [Propionicimonas paludicola]|uniref:Cobalt-zinc-cadmium efflux system protein n=1 Tax=Propionicimonas paludicola TaxID=185243 RepID=A0A2A9CW93_9ACTN|nr:cation diffusion facilitator family transporter [Propionicimonas paludicola]PFG17942.1 cobalt-zinc-cadmium efflux system protein [Propionicimonas paludicola]